MSTYSKRFRTKTCVVCKNYFETSKRQQVFCSKLCGDKVYSRITLPGETVPTGSVGAASELRVATDLLLRGFEVFRSVSQCASCDLVALKNGQVLRVEVRTGYVHFKTGKRTTLRPKTNSKYDLFAVNYADGIIYEPPL